MRIATCSRPTPGDQDDPTSNLSARIRTALSPFGFVPKIVRPLITGLARKQVAKTYDLQGLGRHTLAEQKGFAERDLAALEALVGNEGYLFGQTPNIFDFTVASLMAGVYDNQPATWLTEIAQSYNNLKNYTERVQAHVGVYGREAV